MCKPQVIQLLDRNSISYRLLMLPKAAYTVDDVVRLAGVNVEEICKTMLIVSKDSTQSFIVVVPGNRKVNMKKLERIVGKKLRFARLNEIKETTGYELGALPPYCHKKRLATFVDADLMKQSRINFGTGIHNLGVEIRSQDLRKLTKFETLEICI